MRLTAPTPAPLMPTPTSTPPLMAAEPAKTTALMLLLEMACPVRAPPASMLERST
jgi:hypothetical protein